MKRGTTMMNRTAAAALAFALSAAFVATTSSHGAAEPQEAKAQSQAKPRRSDRPAQRRAQQRAAASADPAEPADAYAKELQAARDQRDKELAEATKETNRRRFEKRKEEIFARYAAIVAAMRDKYEAAHAEAADGLPPVQPAQRPGTRRRPGAVRPATAERPGRPEWDKPDAPGAQSPRKNRRTSNPADAGDDPASARQKLEEEVARNHARLQGLNKQLAAAQSAGNKREVRKVQRAIEKENTTFRAKKAILERRVRELGGVPRKSPAQPPPPAAR